MSLLHIHFVSGLGLEGKSISVPVESGFGARCQQEETVEVAVTLPQLAEFLQTLADFAQGIAGDMADRANFNRANTKQ